MIFDEFICFDQCYFLLTAGSIGETLKHNLFWHLRIGMVSHWRETEKKICYHPKFQILVLLLLLWELLI